MNAKLKKLFRTAQVNFPFLLDLKFAVVRAYRRGRRIPFEGDFRALGLFPDTAGALYLDVGANRGQSTDAILLMTRSSRIHLFEPNPLLYRKLVQLYGRNDRVVIDELGLGDETAEMTLYVPYYKRWMFDGLASFDREGAASWLKGRMFFYDDRHLSLRETRCRIRRLDEMNLSPFFIKLDIQGFEFQAIKGAERTIKTHEPVLLIESPPDPELTDYLKDLGYRQYAFEDGKFIPGGIGSHNTFFMTDEKSALVKNHIVTGAGSA